MDFETTVLNYFIIFITQARRLKTHKDKRGLQWGGGWVRCFCFSPTPVEEGGERTVPCHQATSGPGDGEYHFILP